MSPKLHLKVLKCFNGGTISLDQAAALATIPNKKAQWDLLLQLGPFASDEAIIRAIKEGETVLELPDENILIIPSREKVNQTPKFGRLPSYPHQDVLTQRQAA